MKGIILAGGAGSRLYPLTKIITKQLQPVYDKPMIYYPLSLLMLVGIKEIMIITTPHDAEHFQNLLGNGERFGISIEYAAQAHPKGISEAYIIAEKFLDNQNSLMILGDNLFHGNFDIFRNAVKKQLESTDKSLGQVFAYQVRDPERYGVVEFDKKTGKVISIEEKPTQPKSHYAIPGLYLLDSSAPSRARTQAPSARGELEITDLVKTYLKEDSLSVQIINRGMAWMDTGTPESLLEASTYIAALEQRQGSKVACLEEVALRMEYYSVDKYKEIIATTPNGPYKSYLEAILKEYIDE